MQIILKHKIIIVFIAAVILVTIFILFKNPDLPTKSSSRSIQVTQSDKPQIVTTKPDLSEEIIIAATDTIEITFNRSLENIGEFKVKIEPKIDYKVELSGDRKTTKIIPNKPYNLGSSYTLTIGPDTKFDGAGAWGETKTFHFRTVKYSGV